MMFLTQLLLIYGSDTALTLVHNMKDYHSNYLPLILE